MTPDLPEELLAWAQATERRVLREAWRTLRAEYHHLFPTPEMKELLQMQADQRLDEGAALATLVQAADNPPREAVTALAIAVQSPWSGDRLLVRDRPQRRAPDYRTFSGYLDTIPTAPAALPVDRGPLAFARYHRVLVPLDTLGGTLPAWLTDPALRGGWVARPPREPCLSGDGRLLALNMLMHAIPEDRRADPGTGLAVTTVIEWCAGIRAAMPTPGLSTEHPVMRWDPRHQMAWLAANAAMNGGARTRCLGELSRPIPPTWTAPNPSPEEARRAAEKADDARRRAAAREFVLAQRG